MVKKKTKKVLKLVMLISMVLLLVSGIGLGIYFIVVSKSPAELLSKT
ncbi:MAG: hypothetical protein IJS74_00960 [Clostridia bacterium]|nr:hypothetical protein [Clostridia bacterium]